MTLELRVVERLQKELDALNDASAKTLIGPPALTFEDYQRSLGYREAIRQVRDVLLPQIVEELQSS